MVSLSLGPLSFPLPVLLLLLSLVVGLSMARLYRHSGEPSSTDALLLIFFGAILVGRVVFVLRFFASYDSLWQMLDFRDRGVDPSAALVTALLLLWVQCRRLKALQKPLIAGTASAATCYILGALLLQSQQQQHQLADIRLDTVAGYQVTLPDLARGQPVVINIWASWCPPCRREMPALMRAEQQFPQVRFMLINLQENRETVQQYLREQQLNFQHVLLDPEGKVASHYGVQGVPATLFFSSDGQLNSIHFGELSVAILQQGIKKVGK